MPVLSTTGDEAATMAMKPIKAVRGAARRGPGARPRTLAGHRIHKKNDINACVSNRNLLASAESCGQHCNHLAIYVATQPAALFRQVHVRRHEVFAKVGAEDAPRRGCR